MVHTLVTIDLAPSKASRHGPSARSAWRGPCQALVRGMCPQRCPLGVVTPWPRCRVSSDSRRSGCRSCWVAPAGRRTARLDFLGWLGPQARWCRYWVEGTVSSAGLGQGSAADECRRRGWAPGWVVAGTSQAVLPSTSDSSLDLNTIKITFIPLAQLYLCNKL